MKAFKYGAIALSILALTACGGDKQQAQSGTTGGDTSVAGEAPKRPECIAPAKPGGGFDLTCKLAQSGLQDLGLLDKPMRVTYMPGGVVRWHTTKSLPTTAKMAMRLWRSPQALS